MKSGERVRAPKRPKMRVNLGGEGDADLLQKLKEAKQAWEVGRGQDPSQTVVPACAATRQRLERSEPAVVVAACQEMRSCGVSHVRGRCRL